MELNEVRVSVDYLFNKAEAVLKMMQMEVRETESPILSVVATPYMAGKNVGYHMSNNVGRGLNVTINNIDESIMLFMGNALDFDIYHGGVKREDTPKFTTHDIQQAAVWAMDWLVDGKQPV